MKDLLKNKKMLAIIAVAILVIIGIAIIGITVGINQSNKKQEEILVEEANKLNSMDIQKDDIDMEIKTKGKYAVVEKTMKEYLNETKINCTGLIDLCTNSQLDTILGAENIENDGPEFTESKEKINTFKSQVNEYIEKLNKLINEENINNAINDKKVDNKFVDLYRNLMLDDKAKESLNQTKESLTKSGEEINKSLDKMNNILNFLSDNKDSWELKDGKIQFKNITKLTEYYRVINQ